MMELKDIKCEEDVFIYIEGCLNDFEAGIACKNETSGHLVALCLFLIEKALKTDKIVDTIKSVFKEMDDNGEMKKIEDDARLFEKYKRNIYMEIVVKAHFYMIWKRFKEFDEYLDQFGIIPTEVELKGYR